VVDATNELKGSKATLTQVRLAHGHLLPGSKLISIEKFKLICLAKTKKFNKNLISKIINGAWDRFEENIKF
jgi:hypothetical protein